MPAASTPDIELLRIGKPDFDKPTRGVLLYNNEILCTTLERPWRNNQKTFSCIPTGCYTAQKVTNRRTTGGLSIPETFEVVGVKDRSGILFHIGNTAKDTQGCILVGLGFGVIEKEKAILQSKLGFEMFLHALSEVDRFTLRVCVSHG